MAKRIAFIIGSLLVSAFFLWLTLRGVPLAEVWDSIQDANIWWVLAAILMGAIGTYTRGIRWRGLVNNQVSVNRAFYIVGIMQMLNNLPMRLGEVARTVLAAREKIPVVTAATSIVVERLLDTLFVLIVLSLIVTRVETLPESITQTAPVFGVLAVVGLAVLIGLSRYPDFVRRILHAITDRLPFLQRLPLENLLDHALDGLRPLSDFGRFTHAAVWTLISWFFSYLVFYFVQLSLTPDANPYPAVLSMPLAAFSMALPLTVAAIGPFQAAIMVAGQTFGIPQAVALANGFLTHGVNVMMYTITGIWGMFGLGVAIMDVMNQPANETEQPITEGE